jgi:RNA polymerase sigma-70 factor (ECF subfamily)
VFIKALLNIGKYEFRGKPFISWLYRIAYNELMQFFRHKKNHRTINADIQDLRFIQEEADIVYFEEFIPQLKELITGLHPDDLILVEMRYFERRPYKEIAEILELSEVNAKVKMHRIIEKLKIQLTQKKHET